MGSHSLWFLSHNHNILANGQQLIKASGMAYPRPTTIVLLGAKIDLSKRLMGNQQAGYSNYLPNTPNGASSDATLSGGSFEK